MLLEVGTKTEGLLVLYQYNILETKQKYDSESRSLCLVWKLRCEISNRKWEVKLRYM